MGLSCLVDDEQGDWCSMPEGLRRFVCRDDRLSIPEQLCTECGEFLGGSAIVRGTFARSVEVPPPGVSGASLCATRNSLARRTHMLGKL
eukprot:6456916-Pyramimonas_sp.AAC.1